MKEKYLVINAGSSSLKFSMYEMPGAVEIVSGLVERMAEGNSSYTLKYDGKKKGITLLDFAVSERMDLTDFTSDTMFFFTEEISMEDFLNKSNTSIDRTRI